MKFLIKIIIINLFLITPIATFVSGTRQVINNISSENNIKNMFVLGDSLSDTGAFVQYQGRITANYIEKTDVPASCFDGNVHMPPSWDSRCANRQDYWQPRTFNPPFYQNSFSNGPVAVELLAMRLGIKNFTPAWYDRSNNLNQIGYNYATGSAKVLSSDYLLSYFSEWDANMAAKALESDRYNLVKQVAALKRHHTLINHNDLLIILIGSNDILEIIEGISDSILERTKEILWERIDEMINSLAKQVKELIDYGFRRIAVGNIPSLFLTPRFFRTRKEYLTRKIVAEYNQKFDKKITSMKNEDQFKGKIKILPMDNFLKDTLERYQNSGVITLKSAVATDWGWDHAFKSTYVPYYINGANEHNVKNYAFFDDIHPSARLNQDMSELLFALLSDWCSK